MTGKDEDTMPQVEPFPRFVVTVDLHVHAISPEHAAEIARTLLDYSTGFETRVEGFGVLRDFALPATKIRLSKRFSDADAT